MDTNRPAAPAPGFSAAGVIPAAAIIYTGHGAADALLADFAFALRRSGWQARGLVQQSAGGGGKMGMVLVDLDDGRRFTGGSSAELAPRLEALEAWFAGLGRARRCA